MNRTKTEKKVSLLTGRFAPMSVGLSVADSTIAGVTLEDLCPTEAVGGDLETDEFPRGNWRITVEFEPVEENR